MKCLGPLVSVVVVFLSNFANGQFGDVPNTPCPDVFIYQSNGYQHYGFGQIKNPPIGEDIRIMAKLIYGTRLPQVDL